MARIVFFSHCIGQAGGSRLHAITAELSRRGHSTRGFSAAVDPRDVPSLGADLSIGHGTAAAMARGVAGGSKTPLVLVTAGMASPAEKSGASLVVFEHEEARAQMLSRMGDTPSVSLKDGVGAVCDAIESVMKGSGVKVPRPSASSAPSAPKVLYGETETAKSYTGQPLRVAVLTPSLTLSGAERWVYSLLTMVDPRFVEWKFVGLMDDGIEDPAMADAVNAVCPVIRGKDPIASALYGCHVVIAWGRADWWKYVPPGVRSILVSHGPGLWTERVFRDHNIATSLAAVSAVATQPIPAPGRPRAVVIHNAVSPSRVATLATPAEAKASLGIDPSRRVLSFIGRFSGEKAPLTLIRTIAALPNKWHGLVVGWGPMQRDIEAEAAPLRDRITILPPRENVAEIFRASDGVLSPSAFEGCSYLHAEAWIAGVPLISTKTGLLLERPDLAGLFDVHGSGPAIAQVVLRDFQEQATQKARVASAQSFAAQELSPEAFAARWASLVIDTSRRS